MSNSLDEVYGNAYVDLLIEDLSEAKSKPGINFKIGDIVEFDYNFKEGIYVGKIISIRNEENKAKISTDPGGKAEVHVEYSYQKNKPQNLHSIKTKSKPNGINLWVKFVDLKEFKGKYPNESFDDLFEDDSLNEENKPAVTKFKEDLQQAVNLAKDAALKQMKSIQKPNGKFEDKEGAGSIWIILSKKDNPEFFNLIQTAYFTKNEYKIDFDGVKLVIEKKGSGDDYFLTIDFPATKKFFYEMNVHKSVQAAAYKAFFKEMKSAGYINDFEISDSIKFENSHNQLGELAAPKAIDIKPLLKKANSAAIEAAVAQFEKLEKEGPSWGVADKGRTIAVINDVSGFAMIEFPRQKNQVFIESFKQASLYEGTWYIAKNEDASMHFDDYTKKMILGFGLKSLRTGKNAAAYTQFLSIKVAAHEAALKVFQNAGYLKDANIWIRED
jgi:ribosomal protein S8